MDLIANRIEKFRKVASAGVIDYNTLLKDAADTIEILSKKLATAERLSARCNDWIPREEELPEKHINVLVSLDGGEMRIAWYSECNNTWIDTNTDKIITLDVKAWRPLPERYQSSNTYENHQTRDTIKTQKKDIPVNTVKIGTDYGDRNTIKEQILELEAIAASYGYYDPLDYMQKALSEAANTIGILYDRCIDAHTWVLCDDRLPERGINPVTKDFYEYQVTFQSGDVTDVRHYKFGHGHWLQDGEIMDQYVIAWRLPLPAYRSSKEQK